MSARPRARAYGLALTLAGLTALPCAGADFTLRVGYQPYFAESWSGAIIRAAHLDAAKLPPGTRVEYKVGLKGAGVLVNALRRSEVDLAYLGLAPAILATRSLDSGDFRIIAVASTSQDLCNVIIARPGAPVDVGPHSASQWLQGKRLGVPRDTCADLFALRVLDDQAHRSTQINDLPPDLLTPALLAGQIDAAALWEPLATALLKSTHGVRLTTGRYTGQTSGSFVVVSASLLSGHADVVRGWLAAEREAQAILQSHAANDHAVELLESQTRDIDADILVGTLASIRASDGTVHFPFIVTPEVHGLLQRAADRLAVRDGIARSPLREGSIADGMARDLMTRPSHGALAPPRSTHP